MVFEEYFNDICFGEIHFQSGDDFTSALYNHFVFVFDKQYDFYDCKSPNMHGLSYELFEKALIYEQPF